jgi:hypothetical protein
MQRRLKVVNAKEGNGSTKTMAKGKLGKDWN